MSRYCRYGAPWCAFDSLFDNPFKIAQVVQLVSPNWCFSMGDPKTWPVGVL